MERFVNGEVVILNFPFSDLSGQKKRPAIVVTKLSGNDIRLCQITSKENRHDEYSLELSNDDFEYGNLTINNSLIRANFLFTADRELILNKIGKINNFKLTQVKTKISEIILS